MKPEYIEILKLVVPTLGTLIGVYVTVKVEIAELKRDVHNIALHLRLPRAIAEEDIKAEKKRKRNVPRKD